MAKPALPLAPALERRLSGTPLVVFLDIDGTLSPIAPRPEDAVIPEGTKVVVRELAALADCRVVVITGRAAADARRIAQFDDAWLVANHGLEVALPGRAPDVREDVAAYATTIQSAIQRVIAAVSAVPGVFVEDKKWSLTVHFRLASAEIEARIAPVITAIGRDLGLRLAHGKKVLELRPPLEINKGTGAVAVARELGALSREGSILCAGDDRTDEDAFRALRAAHSRSVTVWVGAVDIPDTEPTSAEFRVSDPGEICQLLKQVLALRRRVAAS
jgi:trehalose-phosphatase